MKFTELSKQVAAEAGAYSESTLTVIRKWHGSLTSVARNIEDAKCAPTDKEEKWILDDNQFPLRSMAVGAAIILQALGVEDLAAAFITEYERAAVKHPGMTLDCDGPTDENRFYALAEEVGEVAASLTYDNANSTGHGADTIAEVTQVGALALAWLTRYQEGEKR